MVRSSIIHITMMITVLRVQRGAHDRPKNNPRARPSDDNPKMMILLIRYPLGTDNAKSGKRMPENKAAHCNPENVNTPRLIQVTSAGLG